MSEDSKNSDAIRKDASGPTSAEVDGRKVEQHFLSVQLFNWSGLKKYATELFYKCVLSFYII